MNFTDKNIAVNKLLDLSDKKFVLMFHSFYETKFDSIKSELNSAISYYYNTLPYFKDFLNYIVEKTNSRLLINKFFIELQENYNLIKSRDYYFFSKQIDIWNDEFRLEAEKERNKHKEIFEREQLRKNKSISDFDSQDFEDIIYLVSIQAFGEYNFFTNKNEKKELTKDFYKGISSNIISKDFLNSYINLWDKCKSDFNKIVQLPLSLFAYGKLFEKSFRVYLGDIKEFEKYNNTTITNAEEWIRTMRILPENKIKKNFCKILKDISKKDWPGELNDHYTNSLECLNIKYEAVFLFKGPAGGAKFREMKLSYLGKTHNQIIKLFKTNVGLILLQHCHNIGEDVRDEMDAFAIKYEKKYCIIDGRDSYKLFKAYGLIND